MSFERYKRQLLIPEIGEEGQKKISSAKVGVVGAGGLGSFVIPELIAAGFGTVRIFEGDRLTLTNLNRQIIYREEDIGKKKSEVLTKRLAGLNEGVKIEVVDEMIIKERQVSHFKDLDIIIDATDNIETKLLLDKFAGVLNIPLVHGAVEGFRGQVGVFLYPKSLKNVYKNKSTGKKTTPVVAPICGVVGSIQVNETLRYITGGEVLLNGKLLFIDLKNLVFREVEVG